LAKQRLDLLLVSLELCTTRQQAQSLIRAGQVLVNRQVVDKPGTEINLTADILVKERSPFVSRGGQKLAKALEVFPIQVSDRICLDGGISTGGFTDCLLKAGAKLVYGIDVGYGQVDWQLRNDPRVILRERTNLRYLTPADLYGDKDQTLIPDLGVVDISFISLTKVLASLKELLQAPRELILLVKPQFEVGKEKVGKKGVVRSTTDQADAILRVCQEAETEGWQYKGLTWSPLLGPAGNIEYLLWLQANGENMPDLSAIARITAEASANLNHPQSEQASN
jgi:23S rRNA (cytidine1920-2'-O)/16S rRNA (cytidine1409-2'-O)-methyltransferase